jgi:hypothetical protein
MQVLHAPSIPAELGLWPRLLLKWYPMNRILKTPVAEIAIRVIQLIVSGLAAKYLWVDNLSRSSLPIAESFSSISSFLDSATFFRK